MAFFSLFKRSALEVKSILCIATVGVFLAIAVVVDGFGSIRIGEFLKINFTFLPLAILGSLYGPTIGFIAGALTDVIGYLVNPVGAFIPWLMLITALEGMIYGIFLYDLKPGKNFNHIVRIVIARFLVCLVCNLILNTLALYSYGFIAGESYIAVLTARVVTNLITFGVGVVLMEAVIFPVKIAYKKITSGRRAY